MLMFTDIQKNFAAVTNSPNKITVQYSSRLPNPSNSDPNTEVLPHTLPISFQAKDPPTLAFKQNASIRSSGNDQLSKETSLYLRALKAKEKAWGSEDITTLDTVYDIGKLYTKQGKFVEAEEMYVRALSGFEKALGANHDRTLKVVDDLEELDSLVAAKVAAQGQ
jgi:tetratricopeptide (TPR) repeat protein